MKRISGIYKIVNKVNGKYYIGSSESIYRRWNHHQKDLRAGCHYNNHLQRAWNKYGYENFEFVIIKKCDNDILLQEEQKYLDECKLEPKNVYNQTFLAGGGNLNQGKYFIHKNNEMRCVHPDVLENYLNDGWNKGKGPMPQYTKDKIGDANKGKKKPVFSHSHRQKLGDATRGRKYKMSEEHKQNIRNALIGKAWSEKKRLKMKDFWKDRIHPLKGTHHNEVTKKKLSNALKGKFLGKNNPRFDTTMYKFENINTGEIQCRTRFDFYNTYKLNASNVNKLLKGKIKSIGGWKLHVPIL